MEEKLSPIQALQILDQATNMLNVSRQSHMQVIAALKTLEAFVKEHSKIEAVKEEK